MCVGCLNALRSRDEEEIWPAVIRERGPRRQDDLGLERVSPRPVRVLFYLMRRSRCTLALLAGIRVDGWVVVCIFGLLFLFYFLFSLVLFLFLLLVVSSI